MEVVKNKTVNTYIAYETSMWQFNDIKNDALRNCFFGTVNLIKTADLDKYKYFGCGIRLDARDIFLLSDGSGFGKTMIIFDANVGSLLQIDN